MSDHQFRRLTPVVVVAEIETVLPFWAAVGAKVGISVPHGERLGFVCIEVGKAEVMYQTVESVQADTAAADPAAYRPLPQQAYLFIEVADLADVERRLAGHRVFLPRRQTFYGSTETGYVDPAGNLVIFAEFPPA